MARIGIVATSGTLKRAIQAVAAELQIQIVVEYGVLEKGVSVARELIAKHGVGVIISSSLTGEMIKAALDIPVITLAVTNYQLLLAIDEAKKVSDRMVFFDVMGNDTEYDFSRISAIMGTSIPAMKLSSVAQADELIKQAKDNGAEALICTGNCMARAGRGIGLPTVLVKPTTGEIRTALLNARDIIDSMDRELEKNKWRTAIVENSSEGIMTVNEQGIITVFNQAITEMSAIPAIQVIGQHIMKMANTCSFIKLLYAGGAEVNNKLIEFESRQFAVSRHEISFHDRCMGYVFHVQKVSQIQQLEQNVRRKLYEKKMVAKYRFDDIIGQSAAMAEAKAVAAKYAKSRYAILLYGESGTGKEMFAQSIHNVSYCKNGPFLGVNCAAIQATLLESELFGYEEGAFTGAKKGGKPGLFELAHGGTLFLDEIGEMPLNLQARLLRVLQEKEVIRVGGDRVIPIDTRVICATNKNLSKLIDAGEFREDLFYRINSLTLPLPALADRLNDIPELAKSLLRHANQMANKQVSIPEYLLDELRLYKWPGNVRQLRNFIEKLVLLEDEAQGQIGEAYFHRIISQTVGSKNDQGLYLAKPVSLHAAAENNSIQVRVGTMDDMERQIVDQLYARCKGDKEQLSRVLGISRTTIWRRFNEQKNGVR